MKEVQNEQLFQELDNEVAATCSGGAAYLYQNDGFNQGDPGRRLTFFEGSDDLGYYNFNDETSSIKITGNKSWVFYQDINNKGTAVTLRPGEYNLSQLQQRGIQNDWISSLRRIDIPASRSIL
ncbi:beta/gamma crystallin-related protein [Nostoc sp.]